MSFGKNERVIVKICGILSFIKHWGWCVGVRAWTLVLAYLMIKVPILEIAKKIKTSQEPAFSAASSDLLYNSEIEDGEGWSFQGP